MYIYGKRLSSICSQSCELKGPMLRFIIDLSTLLLQQRFTIVQLLQVYNSYLMQIK